MDTPNVEAGMEAGTDMDPRQKFALRIEQLLLHGWQLIATSDDPPRATLSKQVPIERKGADQHARQADPVHQRFCREVWIDAAGEIQVAVIRCADAGSIDLPHD